MADRPVMMAEAGDAFWLLCEAEDGVGFYETAFVRPLFPDALSVLGSHLRGEERYEFREHFVSIEAWDRSFKRVKGISKWPIDL